MKKLEEYVLTIPDFPEPGIMFRDITSVIQDPDGLKLAVDGLYEKGCRAIIFVEYVPADGESEHLAPGEAEQLWMRRQIRMLRRKHRRMVFIAFPGDEKSSDGCVAAGRGFFHINSHGGAEPCPFSPYSDCSVRDSSIREALRLDYSAGVSGSWMEMS